MAKGISILSNFEPTPWNQYTADNSKLDAKLDDKPAKFNDKYTRRVDAQLVKLEKVKTHSTDIKDRKSIKQKILNTASTFDRILWSLISLTLIASPALVFLSLIISALTAFPPVAVAAAITLLFMILVVLYKTSDTSDTSGTSAEDIPKYGPKTYNETLLDNLEDDFRKYFTNNSIYNKKDYHYFIILIKLQELDDVNDDPELSQRVNTLYLKMNNVITSKNTDVTKEKLYGYAEKSDIKGDLIDFVDL